MDIFEFEDYLEAHDPRVRRKPLVKTRRRRKG